MKNFLYLHIQTSSIPTNFNARPENYDQWPRAVTIGWSLKFSSFEVHIIRPLGFQIDPSTSDYIKISNETAIQRGKNIKEVLNKILADINKADYIISHNINFHLNILKSELYRNNLIDKFTPKKSICLMDFGRNFCKITHSNGYKYPSLLELYSFCFQRTINYRPIGLSSGAYVAEANLRAIHSCFNHMRHHNVFSSIQINPLIDFFVIPLNKKNSNYYKKIKFNNSTISYDDYIIYNNIIDCQEVKDTGLYILQRINERNKTEYIIIDYRGVLICKSEVALSVAFHYGMEISGIFIRDRELLMYTLHFPNFGVLISQCKVEFCLKGIIVITDYFERKTVLKADGGIIVEKANVLYDEKSEYVVVKHSGFSNVFNSHGKVVYKTNHDIISISENYLYFKENEKQGLLDIAGQIIIPPIHKTIWLINDGYYCFSNISKLVNNVECISKMGLSKINGEVILEEIYDEINIDHNGIVRARQQKETFTFELSE